MIQPLLTTESAGTVSARDAQKRAESESFAQVLARAEGEPPRSAAAARDAAEQLISVALVQPIFERIRASNQAAPPFGPGDTEKTFGGLLDAEMARRMTKSGQWPLVEAVASRLRAKVEGTDAGTSKAAVQSAGAGGAA
ncbi:MAG: hypothetical protein ACOYN0_08270 [Phycisphaerales bacterium]